MALRSATIARAMATTSIRSLWPSPWRMPFNTQHGKHRVVYNRSMQQQRDAFTMQEGAFWIHHGGWCCETAARALPILCVDRHAPIQYLLCDDQRSYCPMRRTTHIPQYSTKEREQSTRSQYTLHQSVGTCPSILYSIPLPSRSSTGSWPEGGGYKRCLLRGSNSGQ